MNDIDYSTVDPFGYSVVTFPNQGVLVLDIPEKYLNLIKDEIVKIKEDNSTHKSYNGFLAGQLQHQFSLSDDTKEKLEPFVKILAQFYNKTYGCHYIQQMPSDKLIDLELKSLWVNFQKKHEYNPPHNHNGVYSFAMWIKIPYELEEERKHENNLYNKEPANSDFFFQYIDVLGNIRQFAMNVDKSKEGCIVFFPSGLTHHVNPFFTSDEERISVSGNLSIKLI